MKHLRFKVGDHAIIMKTAITCPEYLGAEVVVLQIGPWAPKEVHEYSGTLYRCSEPSDYLVQASDGRFLGSLDEHLIPLKGDDEQFRRENSTDKPRQVTA